MNARFLGANIKMLRLFQHQGSPTSQLNVLSFRESEYPVAGSRFLPPLHRSHLENYRLQGGRTLQLPSLSLGIGRPPMNRSDDLSGLADMPFTAGNSLPPRLVHPWPALTVALPASTSAAGSVPAPGATRKSTALPGT